MTSAYSYDSNNRITQYGGTTYSYDDNGNTLTETLDGVTKTYTYNSQNELVGVDDAINATTYQYNVDGIRATQTSAGITRDYLVDHNRDYAQVLAESENGTQIVAYVYGDDLISQQRGADTSFYHYDGLGSTRGLSDTTGTITDTYEYEAFGEVLNQTGSTENNYLFTGEQLDNTLNQYYLRARYYNQANARFTQMDTWMGRNQDPITLHKYLYAHADPISHIDPTGNSSLNTLATVQRIQAILFAGFGTAAAYQLGQNLFETSDADGVLSDKARGLLILMMGTSSPLLYNLAFKEDGESDLEKMNRIKATPIPETGDGSYKVLTRCHVKRAGSGEPTIGFVEGIGFGVTLPQAVTNAQASANARCVNGTQARHCKARECWQGRRKIPCPRGNN